MNQTAPVVHFRSIGLRNNAGMDFPACYARARLLDTDKSRLPTTGNPTLVTCRWCRNILAK